MKIPFRRQSWRMQSRSLCLSDLLETVCIACEHAFVLNADAHIRYIHGYMFWYMQHWKI